MTARYVHGDGTDQPLVWYQGSATTAPRYLYADERGSVTAITDASGVLTNVNAYDEYGIPAAGNVGRFQYTGQAWLPELGLYYYKARMYSPTLGRFMQTDPIGYGDGLNMYAYVGSDPVNATDPSGTQSACQSGNPSCPHNGPPSGTVVVIGPCRSLMKINVNGRCVDPAGDPGLDWITRNGWDAGGLFAPGGQSPQVGAGTPQKAQCKAPSRVAYYAGLVANYADTGALISGGAAIVTSETGAGLLGFGGVALLLKGVSLTANGIKVIAQGRSGDIRGAGATAAGALASTVTGGALAAASKYARTTGTLSRVSGLNKAVTYTGSETTSALSGKAGSAIVCPGS